MATYFGTSINESPTIIMEAGAKLEDVQGIALAITAGKLAKPSAGANVIGLSLFTNDENVEAGGSLTVQVKDIGKWVAGEAIAVGDELATDAAGKAVARLPGQHTPLPVAAAGTGDVHAVARPEVQPILHIRKIFG